MSERHNPYLRKYLAGITLYSNTIQRNAHGSHTHTQKKKRKGKKGFFLCPKAFNKQNLVKTEFKNRVRGSFFGWLRHGNEELELPQL